MKAQLLPTWLLRICLSTCLLTELVCSSLAAAQEPTYADRTRAIQQSDSRAQQEADSLVSLSADKIISILTQEPGLLLAVKKLLVRKAYDQGRLLDPQDLDDDAVYKLVRADHNVRALITRELEDRYYVRAKPNSREREEMERRGTSDAMHNQTQLTGLQQGQTKGQSQEDTYWSKRDQQSQSGGGSNLPLSPIPGLPNLSPQAPPPSNDSRRSWIWRKLHSPTSTMSI